VGSCGLDASGCGQGPMAGLVNMVVNLQVPQKQGISGLAE
jgi:hypothetical protein